MLIKGHINSMTGNICLKPSIVSTLIVRIFRVANRFRVPQIRVAESHEILEVVSCV